MAGTDERVEAGGQLQVKDVLVLIPLFGSLLAMTWEVGQFIPTGNFRLFTLSEHLLSAVAALPFALIAAVILIVGLPFFPTSDGMVPKLFDQKSKVVIRRNVLIGTAIFVAAVGTATLAMGMILRHAAFFGGAIFAGGFAAFLISRPNRFVVYAFYFVCSLLVTMGLAIDEMRGYLNNRPDLVSTIYAKTAAYRGKVIMSGERGLLFFRPEQNDFVFLRQDEIQRIEWPRFKLLN